MNCLRCGRETVDEGLFCPDCLDVMKDCPIPPRTAVLLPRRREEQPVKKLVRRKIPSAEEQLKRVKRQLRCVTAAMVLFAILAGAFGVMGWRFYVKSRVRPGQNYTSVTSTVTPREK